MVIESAVTAAVGIGQILISIWGFYCSVVLGVAAVIAALSVSKKGISDSAKWLITFVIIVFGTVNFWSLFTMTDDLNKVLEFICKIDADGEAIAGLCKTGGVEAGLAKVIGAFDLAKVTLIIQPIGLAGVVLWLWFYKPTEAE